MKRLLSKLTKAQIEYESIIGRVEQEIVDRVDFEFGIFWQPSDGFVMCDDAMGNAPISACLYIIKEKGILTHDDFKGECI